ncbi:hypothetical protein [Actinomyces oris]|uniref:Uncharacterized protein n=2 Tax=Actinomyces oris TaxID=544580 RepID=A0A1Q8HY39_9ACTO|nr:hypothetical protein [Actinomyces oris]OLL13772.1 hypothetical protein BKH32_12025 [Actinomyces oris]
MSYDILIFEPGAVTDEGFPQWWDRVSRWEEPHRYDSLERATPAIRSFYRDLISAFPPFNGPDALTDDEAEARLAQGFPVTEYTVGGDFVYVGVSWSAADALVTTVGELAWTHRLAVAYVSDEGVIVRPPEQPVQSASSVRVDYVVQHSMR